MVWSLNSPKVFISYSRNDEAHQERVLHLAERLMSDWIIVMLDKRNLKTWQDMYDFMEQMVKDEEIDHVLVISDKHYQKKADERKWWVWTESQLISEKVYKDTKQEKFIPIIKEKTENWEPCLPVYMKSRLYIDLSDDSKFEEWYKKLVRVIYWKMEYIPPQLWTPPDYILEDEPVAMEIVQKNRNLKKNLLKDNQNIDGYVIDYLESLVSDLSKLEIEDNEIKEWNIDDLIYNCILKLIPIRDEFIEMIKTVFRYWKLVNIELFCEFYENLMNKYYKGNTHKTEHFLFFVKDSFLYLVATLISCNRYRELEIILWKEYFISVNHRIMNHKFEIFNTYIESLDEIRNRRLDLKRVSLSTDIMKDNLNKNFSFDNLVEADMLLYYISLLQWRGIRFPYTSIFYRSYSKDLPFFYKLKSKSYCDKVQWIFRAKEIASFVVQLRKIEENHKSHMNSFNNFYYDIMGISYFINFDKIWSVE